MTISSDLFDQAQVKMAEGFYDDAIEAFSACLALSEKNAWALNGRGSARFHIKDWAGAEADFRAALALTPDEPETAGGLALSLAMQNQVYPAIKLFEETLAKHPEYVQGYIHLGMLQIKVGAVARGKDLLNEALRHRPSLDQRRFVENSLKEQGILDKNRFYRPDFERLRGPAQPARPGRLRQFFSRICDNTGDAK